MDDMTRFEILASAVEGDIAAVSDKIEEYGASEVRKVLFWDLQIFSPLNEDIRAVFNLFAKTQALTKALDIFESPSQLADKSVLDRCIAETDFFDEHEENAYFRLLTSAAIIGRIDSAAFALIEERKRRGL